MPTVVDRTVVQKLVVDRSAQLVEVLPEKEYEAEHLPGAISIPLGTLNRESVRQLDPGRPIVVYCYDYQ